MSNNINFDLLYSFIIKERFMSGLDIFNSLEKQKITYAIHKGAILSYMLYGNFYTRKSGDVDFLFAREDCEQVKKMFEESGFIQGRVSNNAIVPYTRKEKIFQTSQTHQMPQFVKSTENKLCPFVAYDCNLDIFWGESNKKTNMRAFLKNTTSIEIMGMTVKKLSPSAEFIALCMHHYKDLNSIYLLYTHGYDTGKLTEIARYVEVVQVDLDELFTLCNQYGVGEYVCYCAHFANKLFPNTVLSKIENELQSEKSTYLLNCFGLSDDERKEWIIQFDERILNTRYYMEPLLSEKDRQKINMNIQLM